MRALLLVVAACGSSTLPPANSPDAALVADAPMVDAGGASSRYLIYERFDAMPTGSTPTAWTTDGVVREVPFAADKSVELHKATGAGTATLGTTFAPQSGRVVFEAKVLARETAGFKAIPYIYDADGTAVASVSFQDGSIEAHVGDAKVVVQPFAANFWYRVRVVVDTDRGVFDLFVDGVRKLHDQALRSAQAAVTRLAYNLDGNGAATLLVDNVKLYREDVLIGSAPAPRFDPRDYGAVGDGVADDRAAIQQAIDAAAGTGGSVVLAGGTFKSGTLTLGGRMTFFIASSATLLGTTVAADYPLLTPATGNTQLLNCKRALLYADQVEDLHIDGGGTIDGQGDAFSGAEGARPILIWSVLSKRVGVENLYLKKGAVWSLVMMETDDVVIRNVNVQSDGITHDGIDIVDGTNVLVEDCAVRSGDDAMCLKSGVRRGIDNLTVRDSLFAGSGTSGGSNGIKFGTATYGAFQHIAIEDTYVKDVQYAAMAVESRQGSDVDGIAFRRIEIANVGAAFFVYLAQQKTTHPIGDVPKLGSMTNISFTDISGFTAAWPNSPHQGSLITGHVFEGVRYPITNLSFTNVALTFGAGRTTIPNSPPEAMPNQYPESNMFGDLPAWAYYLRHVDQATFTNVRSSNANTDARQPRVTDDASGILDL